MDSMNKKSYEENVSIRITKAFIITLFLAAVGLCILGPTVVKVIMQTESPMLVDDARFWTMLICGYICAVILFIFLYVIYTMVNRIQKGEVFVVENVKALSLLSNLVLGVCIVSLLVGISCTYMLLIITVATAFVTPIIRVVKNAFGKAVEMQDELDFTV